MNIVKGLIIKDLMNIKSYKTTMIYLVIIFLITNTINDEVSTVLPIMITLIFGMVGISSFSYDSFSKSDKYILSFPVSKKDIVKARYMYILIMTVIGAIIGSVIAILVQFFKTKALNGIGDISMSSVGALLGMLVLQIIQIPIMYKFGAEKGRIIQMISIVLVMTIISGVTALLIKTSPYTLEDFLVMLKRYGGAIAAIIVGVLYYISYRMSYKIYSKKEI